MGESASGFVPSAIKSFNVGDVGADFATATTARTEPSHEALRGQLHSIRLGDIDLANRTMEIRLVVPPSATRCTPGELQGGVVEIHLEGVPQPPTAGAVVHDGCFSAVIIDTYGARWPRDAEVISLRLIEPLVPTES